LRRGIGVVAFQKVNALARDGIVGQNRGRGPSAGIGRLRACWVTQAPSGLVVTPATWTRRVPSSMQNSTSNRRSHTVSTLKQSQAMIPAACWRRNARQVVAGAQDPARDDAASW
jgi:hypothetical protein